MSAVCEPHFDSQRFGFYLINPANNLRRSGVPASKTAATLGSEIKMSPNKQLINDIDRIKLKSEPARQMTQKIIDTLGRYESRLSRQLLKYEEEFAPLTQ
jgi:hypothetical protein